jgi:hypothetical protein
MNNPVTLKRPISAYQYGLFCLYRLFLAVIAGIHGVMPVYGAKTIDNARIMKVSAGNHFLVACFYVRHSQQAASNRGCLFAFNGNRAGGAFFRVII